MSDLSSLPPDFTPPNATEPTPPPVLLPEPTRDERTLGMLAHVLQIVSWLIAPLIIFLVRKDSRFVRYHALQAVFFQLLVMLVWGATFLALFAGFFAALAHHRGAVGPAAIAFPILFFVIFWGGGALTWFLNLVLGIVYGLRANNGEWAGYPGIKYLAAKVAGVELPH
jgi:uncharacterized Tic20 family protein